MFIRIIILLSCIVSLQLTIGMEPRKIIRAIVPIRIFKQKFDITKHPLYFDNLQLPTEVNKIGENENTPLMFAVRHNLIEHARILLEIPEIDINHANNSGNTAAHFGAIRGDAEMLELLLQHHQLNASLKNNQGKTPHEYLPEAEMINYKNIRNGFHRNIILHTEKFSDNSHFDVQDISINNMIVNRVDAEGTSPLIWAIVNLALYQQNDTFEHIKKFLSYKNLNVNYNDKQHFGTALHYAAYLGLSDVIQLLLLDCRTNACIKNKYGLEAQNCIIKDGSPESGQLSITLFSRAWLNLAIKTETCILTIDTSAQDIFQESQLSSHAIDLIIQKIKSQKEKENNPQASVLPENSLPDYATDDFLADMIKANYIDKLLKKQKYVDSAIVKQSLRQSSVPQPGSSFRQTVSGSRDADGNTHLMHITKENIQADLTSYLLTTDPNAQSKYGMTALHYAASNSNEEYIKCLLQDPRTQASLKNKRGFTAHDLIPGINEKAQFLRNILFARISLENAIAQECSIIKMFYPAEWETQSITEEHKYVIDAVRDIRFQLQQDKDAQVDAYDRQLLDSACLPTDIDNDFIKQMIVLRLYPQ